MFTNKQWKYHDRPFILFYGLFFIDVEYRDEVIFLMKLRAFFMLSIQIVEKGIFN